MSLPDSTINLLELMYCKKYNGDQSAAYRDYKRLNCRIRELPKYDPAYGIICTYVRNTHGPTHSMKLSVKHIFTVRRKGEYENYKPNKTLKNRKLLWHGSRANNFPSILSQGLKCQPPAGVPTTGKMFGNGVYFADVVTKSAQYCFISPRSNPYGILLLAEVALGKHYYKCNPESVQALRKGKSSVKGLGKYKPDPNQTIRSEYGAQIPLGTLETHTEVTTVLDYSEYIIYNDNQILFQYLVLFKQN